jgi:hypothetical protein
MHTGRGWLRVGVTITIGLSGVVFVVGNEATVMKIVVDGSRTGHEVCQVRCGGVDEVCGMRRAVRWRNHTTITRRRSRVGCTIRARPTAGRAQAHSGSARFGSGNDSGRVRAGATWDVWSVE